MVSNFGYGPERVTFSLLYTLTDKDELWSYTSITCVEGLPSGGTSPKIPEKVSNI